MLPERSILEQTQKTRSLSITVWPFSERWEGVLTKWADPLITLFDELTGLRHTTSLTASSSPALKDKRDYFRYMSTWSW